MSLTEQYSLVHSGARQEPDAGLSTLAGTQAQREKAFAAMQGGALHRVSAEAFLVRSATDPATFYRATISRCTCPARAWCWHILAVRLALYAEQLGHARP